MRALLLVLVVLLAACSHPITDGEVVSKHYKPEWSGFRPELSPECGLALDGSGMDCGGAKLKMVYRHEPEEWIIRIYGCRMEGTPPKEKCYYRTIEVSKETWNSVNEGDWFTVP